MKLPVDKSLVKLGRVLRSNGTKSEAFYAIETCVLHRIQELNKAV